MTTVDRAYFLNRADIVARSLLGTTLVCEIPGNGRSNVRLTEIAAYQGETQTTSSGVLYAHGVVSISTKFGQQLIDIATGRKDEPSCITLRGGEVVRDGGRGKRIEGPGRLTCEIGITHDNKDLFEGEVIPGSVFWIDGTPGESLSKVNMRKRSDLASNCLGYFYLKP